MRIVSALGPELGALPASQRPAVLVNQAGARRLRPFARRRRMTARPERVRIRARNPWTFLRRRRLGWNVRFMGSGVWRACSANRAERLAGLGGRGAAFRLPPSEVPTKECMRGSRVRQLAFCHLFAVYGGGRGAWSPGRPDAAVARRESPRCVLGCFCSVIACRCRIGRDSAPVLYSASSQRGSPPPSPRAGDFCSVNRLERCGYLIFNRCG